MRLYKNCSELPKWNFDEINSTKDFRWLIQGYEWGEVEVPENAQSIWDEIVDEYAALTEDNSSFRLFQLLVDASDAKTRIAVVTVLLMRLSLRGSFMDGTNLKAFAEELRNWRFYLNESKPLREEIERMEKQLKAAGTKLNAMNVEIEKLSKDEKAIDPTELKVRVQNMLKRHIDFKQISVKEWIYTVKEATKHK